MGKALDGVRVLDMTHVQSGPSCTQILAWLGADVVKLEAPAGDVTRKQLRDIPGVDSLYFTMLNCNKQSITLNMKSPEGKRIFADLLPRFDILAENFGPGAIERMGFGWDELQRINPRLIFASIKGFGDGPYTHYKAYEVIAQAMGGSMSTTGFEEGPPLAAGAQMVVLPSVPDLLAADFQRQMKRYGITAMLVPTMVVNHVVREDRNAFASLRVLGAGGDVLLPSACRALLGGRFAGSLYN